MAHGPRTGMPGCKSRYELQVPAVRLISTHSSVLVANDTSRLTRATGFSLLLLLLPSFLISHDSATHLLLDIPESSSSRTSPGSELQALGTQQGKAALFSYRLTSSHPYGQCLSGHFASAATLKSHKSHTLLSIRHPVRVSVSIAQCPHPHACA
jgi:hypothetical protein